MLKSFHIIAYLEGISLLALFFIAMPMKYVWHEPALVKYVGWAHGLLFIAYVVILAQLASAKDWPMQKTAWGLVASLLPFGAFIFDKQLHQETSTPA